MAWIVCASEGAGRRAAGAAAMFVAFLSMGFTYPACATVEPSPMRKRKTDPEQLLQAIAESVDDGFFPATSLHSRFPKLGHRELVGLRKRAARDGLVLERRGPDGRTYLALTAEGWRALRAPRGSFRPR